MPKVLLTGVVGPHRNLQFNIAGDRLTRDQDIFTLASHTHYVALHFIAANLAAPCVVLEHPTMEEFERELENGYDFVGINFTLVDVVAMAQMCETVRREAPDTQIVLGGYGTSCFTTIFKGQQEIRQIADHICHGEGVTFMRRLLGESLDVPIRHSVGPRGASAVPWLDPYPPGESAYVVSGLGCANRCEFCCTSAYYDGQFIELDSAEGLFSGIKEIWRCEPDSRHTVGVFDENLYKDKEKVSRLGQLIREDREFGLGKISYFSFGTVEDLSRYDVVEDLVMNGVGSIWIGVESLFTPLRKRRGRDVRELFDDLHAHGITTIGSWIGGWDFHDPKNIQEDLDAFVALEPTQSQLFPLIPPPGTALYERLVSSGRLPDISLARSYFGRTSGSEFGFPDWRKNFSEEEISSIVESGHGRLYRRAGPSVMRALRVELNGYEFCRSSSKSVLREERSRLHEAHCRAAYPLIQVCEFFAPNERVREKIRRIRADYRLLFGEPSAEQQVRSSYAMLKGSLYKIATALGRTLPPEPPLRRYEYTREARAEGERPYLANYPRPDPVYEHRKAVYENEMRLVDRLVEQLEGERPTAPEGDPSARMAQALAGVESVGKMAKLIDEMGTELGLEKAWLRSQQLRSLGADGFDAAAGTRGMRGQAARAT